MKIPAAIRFPVGNAALLCLAITSLAGHSHAASFLVDFGDTATGTVGGVSWNNVSSAAGSAAGVAIDGMTSTAGVATEVDLVIVSRFHGANANGTQDVAAPYASTATRDSLYGNTETWQGLTNITPIFKLTGLDLGQAYDLTFYASRTGVSDNRETVYTIDGATNGSISLNAANNITNRATYQNMLPDASGEITISLSPGPANDNAYHFTYLNVLEITAVPEPSSAVSLTLGALLLLRRRRSR